MPFPRSFVARVIRVLTIVMVAMLAAACAHVAIDVLGDVLLPHDSYDDVAHDSRTVAAVVAVTALLAVAAGSIASALRRADGSRTASRAFEIRSPLRFVTIVAALTVPLVLVMEAIDAAAAGRIVDDLGDLFGGSVALGLGTTLAIAVVLGIVALLIVRWFCSAREALVRIVFAIFTRRDRAALALPTGRDLRRAQPTCRTALARYARKRGPPLLVC